MGDCVRFSIQYASADDHAPKTLVGKFPATVVDWQSIGFGPPASDVGYFMAGALSRTNQKQLENDLLKRYRTKIKALAGVDYSQDDLLRHYVCGGYQLFLTAFVAAMLVTQTPRGDDMFFKMLNGSVDLIFDFNADDWFS